MQRPQGIIQADLDMRLESGVNGHAGGQTESHRPPIEWPRQEGALPCVNVKVKAVDRRVKGFGDMAADLRQRPLADSAVPPLKGFDVRDDFSERLVSDTSSRASGSPI